MITYERAIELFHYDDTTGNLIWKRTTSNRAKIGGIVGNIFNAKKAAYRQTSIDGKKVLIHHLVWLFNRGHWPQDQIDHIDGNGLNNRIENLRVVSCPENMRNRTRRVDNKSGHLGVSWNKKAGKWIAQIQVDGKNIYLGLFSNIDDAVKERKRASEHYGFHKNHGRSN